VEARPSPPACEGHFPGQSAGLGVVILLARLEVEPGVRAFLPEMLGLALSAFAPIRRQLLRALMYLSIARNPASLACAKPCFVCW
jgi:hypothetical protein